MRSNRWLVLLIACILSSVMLVTSGAHAQSTNQQYITITPTTTAVTIAPGQQTAAKITILNQGTGSFDATLSASPYWVDGLAYDPQFTQLPGTTEVDKWVTIPNPQTKTLAPDGVWDVTYTISVPASTQPGGYYAVLFAESSSASAAKNVVSHNRVGQIIYITVSGAVTRSGEVTAVPMKHFSLTGDLAVATKVKNTGGIHFSSKVSTVITDVFGRTVYTKSDERYVLPQTERKFSISWQAGAAIGLYHITRTATTPQGSTTLPTVWVFVMQPLLIGIIIVVVLLAGYLLSRLMGKKRKKTYVSKG